MKRPFRQVDVFGEQPYSGNPVAVVLDAAGISTENMQKFTRWMNLSETTFVLPPTADEADYRVRIFTPTHELPFAGHPTLGTCHAWLEAGGQPKQPDGVIQECQSGLIPIKRNGGLAFAAPPLLRSGEVEEAFIKELVAVLGISRGEIVDAQWVDNGPGWVGILLANADAVLSVEPDFGRYTGCEELNIGLVGPCPEGSDCAFEVRAIFSDERGGMIEDPVTGSLNASLAEWLISTGRVQAPYVSSQGTLLGRKGRPRIDQDADNTIWLGGNTFTCISGEVDI